ncbi:hypothetical protein GCM10007913_15130 [Devosia yakushimensis]|uniref:Uncharacterized protein n=1 Tax=Devosia yakushimensis TaxID=470028 RepID=A0ABQ5UG86_9HYPH|nr:hypothetical protein [Devosia yakushimensis]GLQ09581.1 hypothetical protein GCM10007913_15130 [Devosia yakushimensis]
MSALLGVIVLFTVLALAIAVVQAVAITRLAPASEQIGSFFPLGWWKFGQIEAKAGPQAARPLAIYKRAVIAFAIFLVLGLILSGWSANRPAQAESTTAFVQSNPEIPARRVAAMPGAPSLES